MIVNIFDKFEKESDVKNNIISNNLKNENEFGNESGISVKKLQKFVIDNGLEYLKKGAKESIVKMLQEYITFNYNNIETKEIDYFISKVLDNMFGYGILQKYIELDKISDIRVVKFNLIYVKEQGKWKKS